MIPIKSPKEIEKMRQSCRSASDILDRIRELVRPGITTKEVDEAAADFMSEAHVKSAFLGYRLGHRVFPGNICISLNDEVVHGIPGDRVIQPGDLVKLDLTAEKDGYHTDSAVSVAVLPAKQDTTARELAHCAERAFRQALGAARIGNRTKDIGRAVEREVRRRGFCVVRELGGHGIGRTIHEPPPVPNYPDFSAQHKLAEGLVITIEPIIAAGTGNVSLDRDGWTYRTTDGSLSAHYEHTIVITRGEPVLLTAA